MDLIAFLEYLERLKFAIKTFRKREQDSAPNISDNVSDRSYFRHPVFLLDLLASGCH